jgi:hypothetical protein
MIKKIDLSIFLESNYFYGESWRWHMSIHNWWNFNKHMGSIWKIVLKKWIKDSKIESMHTVEDEFNEVKEEISKF